jgi:hypothetical protein
MRKEFWGVVLTTASLVCLSGLLIAQHDQQSRTLMIEGHTGEAQVIEKDGRAYVDLRSLVEIANASLSFKGNRVILSLPASAMSHPVEDPAASQTQSPVDESSLSREFVRAGIEEIATLREWGSTMAYAIQNNYNITQEWASNYREQAANSLRLASAAASSDADRKALQLLTNEFNAMRQWSDKLVAARNSMDTAKYAMSPDALRNEPLSQKLLTCGHFLAQMLGSGSFQDDGSCH